MRKKHKIFVVDDDSGFRKTLSDILRLKGYDVLALDTGHKALSYDDLPPVVALIDLRLGDMSGLSLMEALKEKYPSIACIVLTGHADQGSAIQALNLGAYGYMQKPYDVEQLLVMIRRAVEMWDASASLREYAERLKNLHQIDQAILEARSSRAIAEAALNGLRQLVPYERGTIVTFDIDKNQATVIAARTQHPSPIVASKHLPLDQFHITEAFRQGEIRIVSDITALDPLTQTDQLMLQEGLRAYMMIPLVSKSGLIGMLGISTSTAGEFLPEYIEMAQEVGAQVTVAIQQTRLNEQIQRDAIELEQHVHNLQLAQAAERKQRRLAETLREVTNILNTTLDLEEVLRIILQQLARVLPYDDASVMLLSDSKLENVASRNANGQNTLLTFQTETASHIQEILTKRQPVIIADTRTDQRWIETPETQHVHCWLGIPLLMQDKVIGLLNLSRKEANAYTDRDVQLTVAFAAQAANAVVNAQLFEQAQQEINERKRAETALEEERASLARRVAERTLELRAVNAELARSARLKDEFLASMSHELRTPLNAVLGLSEALQEEIYGPLNGKQQDSLKTIEESGRHLLALINDILDVSKIGAGKLILETGPVSAEAVCYASLAMVKQTAHKKRLRLISNFDEFATTLEADERRLKQILVNLLSNAVKFTPEGGEVGLEVTGDIENKIIRFTVWDSGIGISEQGMTHLFEPFVQLDSSLAREHMGTGLGLTLVHRLTEMHNGGISVESELGKGSQFTISLPWHGQPEPATVMGETNTLLADAQSAILAAKSATPPEIPTNNPLFEHLDNMGFEVSIHPQGVDALEQASVIHPDLIILDIMLPDMSGWEVLAQLKLDMHMQDVPVVMVSGINDHTSGLTWGAAGHLVKPISQQQLEEVLARVLPYQKGFSAKVMVIMSPQEPTEESQQPIHKPTILLAEDNENNVNTISGYLMAKGYRVVVAWNGREAIAETRELLPDLILMDIQMPVMDGLEAIQRLRADPVSHTIPIIALTALAMSGDREKCLQAGANEYLSKPVSLQRLVKTIELYLSAQKDPDVFVMA